MCVELVNNWEVASEDIVAYKIVRKKNGRALSTRYISPTDVNFRADQGYGQNAGSVLQYKLGKKLKSDEPGIYCLAHPMMLVEDDMVLLEVIIPKGTNFRRGRAGVRAEDGQTFEMRTLNALVVKVVKEYKGKIDGKFMWPVAARAMQCTWNYITTSTSTYYVMYSNTAMNTRTID